MQSKREFQTGRDDKANADQLQQALLLQSLGFSNDPTQSANLTNALIGGGNAAAGQAAGTQNSIGQLANLAAILASR